MSTIPTLPPTKKPRTTKFKNRHRKNHPNSTIPPLIPTIASALSAAHSFLSHDLHLLPSYSLSLQSSLLRASISLLKIQSLLQINNTQLPIFLPSQNSCWFQRFLISASVDEDPRWVHTFRMSKPTFDLLNSILSDSLSSSLPVIPTNFALGVALYRFAHNGSFSFVGSRFGLSSKDSCRAFYTVCRVICDQLGGYLGEFGSDMERVLMDFANVSLPNCCGVLGVEKFPVEGEVLGKNGFLMVQALVDSNGRFLDVSAGWPSTLNPSSILPQTKLFSCVEESKELLNALPIELNDGNLLPQYILGDSCYPLRPWLLTPFEKRSEVHELSLEEREFNDVHKRAMGLVRVAFRRVRANWQLLNRRWKEEFVEFLPFIITTACLLNNFLMKHGEVLLDGESGCVEEQEIEWPASDEEVNEGSRRTRDILASHLSQAKQRI